MAEPERPVITSEEVRSPTEKASKTESVFNIVNKSGALPALDDVLRIAGLAHLHLSPDEMPQLVFELRAILGYMSTLEELDTSAVPATAHVQIERLALRPDEPAPSLPRDLALREAPRVADDGFSVPAFVDEG